MLLAKVNWPLRRVLTRIPGRERPHTTTTAVLMRQLAALKPENIVVPGHRRYCTVPLDVCRAASADGRTAQPIQVCPHHTPPWLVVLQRDSTNSQPATEANGVRGETYDRCGPQAHIHQISKPHLRRGTALAPHSGGKSGMRRS